MMSQVPAAVSAITGFITKNPFLCLILFVSYGLFYLYSFVHNRSADSDVYEIDMISSGVSSILVALMLLGLDESSESIVLKVSMTDPGNKIALMLLGYAIVLIILAFIKVLPKFIVVILGNSELDLFINLVAALMTDPKVAINTTLLVVIAVPLALLFVVQRVRRMMG
jgi:hypothetical protein